VRNSWLLTTLFVALASCSDPTATRNDLLVARATEKEVVLENRTNTPVVAMIFEQQTLARIDFTMCERPVASPTDCGAIQPGETRHVPNSSITGYHPGANGVVINARLVKDPLTGSYVRDILESIVIKLR
jgi:hypothetical protein